MMEVERYDQRRHYETLLGWLEARGAYLPSIDEMPAVGCVAYNDTIPVAIGFLRRVEGGHAQLDGLTTSPLLPPEIRSRGIDFVVERLIEEAKDLGIRSIVAFTLEPNVLSRSAKFGFIQLNQAVIVLKTN